MLRNLLVLLCLLPLAVFAQSRQLRSLPAPAEYDVITDHDGKVRTSVQFRLCLNADGRIACLEPLPDQNRQTVNAVLQRVPAWRFGPASLNGAPAAAESTLTVFLEGEPGEGGGYEMRITRAATGTRAIKRPAPKYPQRELKRQRAGSVLLRVEVQGDGTVAKVEADEEYSDAGFVAASVQAVRRWTFEPERIGGQPVPARVLIPVSFHVSGQPRKKPLWTGAYPDLDEHPQALDSAIGPITGPDEE